MGVRTMPGLTLFARTPRGPHSAAICRVRPQSAALLAAYALTRVGMRAPMDATLALDPDACCCMAGASALAQRKAALTLTLNTASQSSSGKASNGVGAVLMP